jgi:hypothetical protein
MISRIAAVLLLLPNFFLPTLSLGASISVYPANSNGAAKVLVQGDLVASDITEFKSKTGVLSNAVIWFQSDGGSMLAGIEIGETIRLKGFATFVPDQSRCASACAIAWLGGNPRYMAARARIGFHAAYNAKSGQETGVGNAVVGAYLTRIGLPYSAVIYITQSSPNSMTWLNVADAKRQGIEVSVKSGEAVLPTSKNISTETGAFVQVSSQRSEPEARAAYQSLQEKFQSILGERNAIIRRFDFGERGIIYRVLVGPFISAEASELCSRLKAAGGQCLLQRE